MNAAPLEPAWRRRPWRRYSEIADEWRDHLVFARAADEHPDDQPDESEA